MSKYALQLATNNTKCYTVYKHKNMYEWNKHDSDTNENNQTYPIHQARQRQQLRQR